MCVAWHPELPSILAIGAFNGEIVDDATAK
jgi:hypothetical protein